MENHVECCQLETRTCRLTEPYYICEEMAKICAYLYSMYSIARQTQTCTHIPPSVHSIFLPSRVKWRYPAASYAFSHCLFLTSYRLFSKGICDDTYSNMISFFYDYFHHRNEC